MDITRDVVLDFESKLHGHGRGSAILSHLVVETWWGNRNVAEMIQSLPDTYAEVRPEESLHRDTDDGLLYSGKGTSCHPLLRYFPGQPRVDFIC